MIQLKSFQNILSFHKIPGYSMQQVILTQNIEKIDIHQSILVKDNILFGRPYKEKRFNKTIEGCDLKQDLEMLPDGLLTEVGER